VGGARQEVDDEERDRVGGKRMSECNHEWEKLDYIPRVFWFKNDWSMCKKCKKLRYDGDRKGASLDLYALAVLFTTVFAYPLVMLYFGVGILHYKITDVIWMWQYRRFIDKSLRWLKDFDERLQKIERGEIEVVDE
jgi:hypothetical protein